MMINSHGHVIYDYPFDFTEGSQRGHSVAELFEFKGHIYSAFSYQNKFVMFKNH